MEEYAGINASCYEQLSAVINSRKVWMYLLASAIGYIYVIDYEKQDKTIVRKLIDGDNEKAERYYKTICKKIVDGTI